MWPSVMRLRSVEFVTILQPIRTVGRIKKAMGLDYGAKDSPRAEEATCAAPALCIVLPKRVEPMERLELSTCCLRISRRAFSAVVSE